MALIRTSGGTSEMNYVRIDTDSPAAFNAKKAYFSLSRDTAPTFSVNGVAVTAVETYQSSNIYRYLFEVDNLTSSDTIATNGRGYATYI